MKGKATPMQGGGNSSVAEPSQAAGSTKLKRARPLSEAQKLSSEGNMFSSLRHNAIGATNLSGADSTAAELAPRNGQSRGLCYII